MSAVKVYLNEIAEPTLEDFFANPLSVRHGYLACVAAYHCIDRFPRGSKNRQLWRNESFAFTVVDMVAHKMKHVSSDLERVRKNSTGIPLSHAVFGMGAFNNHPFNTLALNEGGLDLRNLKFLIREALGFVRSKAEELDHQLSD